MVSNWRQQVFEAHQRRRINQVVLRFHEFCADWARRAGDRTFAVRLALGLARSFATSARFVLDEEFARTSFLRARFLLQQVASVRAGAFADFRIHPEVLVD
jgi:hypothetical protein